MGLFDELKNQTEAREVFVPRSFNEIFADNRKYICQDKVDPAKIRSQFVKEGNRFVVTVGKASCPTGRLIVGDPLAYLWREQDVLADTLLTILHELVGNSYFLNDAGEYKYEKLQQP